MLFWFQHNLLFSVNTICALMKELSQIIVHLWHADRVTTKSTPLNKRYKKYTLADREIHDHPRITVHQSPLVHKKISTFNLLSTQHNRHGMILILIDINCCLTGESRLIFYKEFVNILVLIRMLRSLQKNPNPCYIYLLALVGNWHALTKHGQLRVITKHTKKL